MKSNLIAGLLIAIGIAFAGFFLAHGIIKSREFDRYVDVKGLAERTVQSDQAVWQLSFNYAANDITSLYAGIADSQNKVNAFLLAKGFSATELEIQPISITDTQTYGSSSENTQAKRYVAIASITVNSNQVEKIRLVVQQTGSLVQSGVILTNSSVNYLFNGLNRIKPAMLDEATANARLAADAFAHNSHSQLGEIRSASQGLFTINDTSNQNGNSSIIKKVRVVTSVQYLLK